MFRKIRTLLLLYVLLAVALTTWSTRVRNTAWDNPLWVVIYPVNGEGNARMASYIRGLGESRFEPIEEAIAQQARVWGIALDKPVEVKLAPAVDSVPPAPPRDANPFAIAAWSLHLRLWAWRHDGFDGPADVRLFVVYYDPAVRSRVAHSLGLQKGFIGVVNGFGASDYDGRNNVVIAHEMLHTLGASDKYDPRTNVARFPDGYAEPDARPLYPQRRAELMAGRIPLSPTSSRMPEDLSQTMIGAVTALEIGWTR